MKFKIKISPDKDGDYVVSCPALNLESPVDGPFEDMIDQARDLVREIVEAETRSAEIAVGVSGVSLSFTVGAEAKKNRSLDEFHSVTQRAHADERSALEAEVRSLVRDPAVEISVEERAS